MQEYISPLQDIVRKIVRQVIDWSEPRLKKITMSHDASNNPAYLVGVDGTIHYCKGGSCAELGSGDGGLWGRETIDGWYAIAPIVNRPVILDYIWLKDDGVNENSSTTVWVKYGGGGGPHEYVVEV